MTRALAKESLISRGEIRLLAASIVELFHPLKIILFGSYAYGDPRPDSDVDLLVIMRHRGPAPMMASRILLACQHDFPIDVLVRSPAEVRHRIRIGDTFVREILSKGFVLYEADDARVGR